MVKSLGFGFLTCALALLTGCASPASLRDGAPVLDVATAQAPDRVADCIGDQLELSAFTSHTRISTDLTGTGGYSVYGHQMLNGLDSAPDTIFLVDISAPEDGRSRIQLYTYFLTRDDWVPQTVRSCL
jgi:hypothetical protein